MIRLTLAALGLLGMATAVAQDAEFLRSMRDDVESLELDSNAARGEALQRILGRLGVAFTLETFQIPPVQNGGRSAGPSVGTNIVVTLGDGNSDIVVGAHYDAIRLDNGRLSRGAVDNAASAVILTRLAAALAEDSLDHRVRVVLFDAEEIGLVGSRRFVEAHAGDDIVAMINLDVNGYGDTIFYGPVASQAVGGLPREMESACRVAAQACVAFPRSPAGDHLAFHSAGIPAVMISLLPEAETEELNRALNMSPEEQRATARPPAILALIHTAADTSARIDPAGMARSLKVVLELVLAVDH
jgi:Zn-dependent M28 family amino/carboxypeptidase